MHYIKLYGDSLGASFKAPKIKIKAPKFKALKFKAPKFKVKVPKGLLKIPKLDFNGSKLVRSSMAPINEFVGQTMDIGTTFSQGLVDIVKPLTSNLLPGSSVPGQTQTQPQEQTEAIDQASLDQEEADLQAQESELLAQEQSLLDESNFYSDSLSGDDYLEDYEEDFGL